MLSRLARRAALPLVLGALVLLAARQGRAAGGLATLGGLVVIAVLYVVLPRLAHRAFERGQHGEAAVYYRIVRPFVADPAYRGAIDVSLAGCRLARADWAGALADLARVDPQTLGASARAAWHNNRAYGCARGALSLAEALPSIEEAVKLRPDVPGFRHTRGVVLLAIGRVDDAIAALDDVWRRLAGEDAPPLLEAERCYDLGVAWTRKGEPDYARDYFQRAVRIAPLSPWAEKAARQLG